MSDQADRRRAIADELVTAHAEAMRLSEMIASLHVAHALDEQKFRELTLEHAVLSKQIAQLAQELRRFDEGTSDAQV